MKRLHQFDYLTELSERAREVLSIPDDATVLNITDKFREGGPIVVSYTRPMSEEEKKQARRQRQAAIDMAIDEAVMREVQRKRGEINVNI